MAEQARKSSRMSREVCDPEGRNLSFTATHPPPRPEAQKPGAGAQRPHSSPAGKGGTLEAARR